MTERIGKEFKKDDNNQQKLVISHFVGNWLLKATFATEDGGNAERVKKSLVEKLKSGVKGLIVDEVLELIKKSDWSKKEGLENFRAEYLRFENKHDIRH